MLVCRQASKIVQGKGELLTGVDSKLSGGIQAEMAWDNFQAGHQEQVSGFEGCWEPY